MRTISEVKRFLDELLERKQPPVIASIYRLGLPTITEADCQRVERTLNILLPKSYRDLLLAYDWSSLRLGNLQFFASAQGLIDNNRATVNPFYKFYKANYLLEIGYYEADRICVRLQDRELEGEILYLDHTKYPQIEAEFVSSSLEQLIVCAAIDMRLKEETNYYKWSDSRLLDEGEPLYGRIMDAILRVEPRADETSFWYKFIRGF